MKSSVVKEVGAGCRVAACAMLILFGSQLAQAQATPTDRAEDALQRLQVGKKMRLVKQTTVKRASLPIAKLGKTGEAPLKGAATSMSATGGNCEGDNSSQDACGGGDEFEVFEYALGFDSIFNAPGNNDVARVEILERVEVTGWRTVYVRAETEWGGLELLLESMNSGSFRAIGIGDDDASGIKLEAEKVRDKPKQLPKVLIQYKSTDPNQWIEAITKLKKEYPDAIMWDTAVVQFGDSKCKLYEKRPHGTGETLANGGWLDVKDVSCN